MIVQSLEKSYSFPVSRNYLFSCSRYLKRGVNEKGRVANDVETEQIVIEDAPDWCTQISSVVQHRGSIPLFWSQETSRLNIKPDIICMLSMLNSSFGMNFVTVCYLYYVNQFQHSSV